MTIEEKKLITSHKSVKYLSLSYRIMFFLILFCVVDAEITKSSSFLQRNSIRSSFRRKENGEASSVSTLTRTKKPLLRENSKSKYDNNKRSSMETELPEATSSTKTFRRERNVLSPYSPLSPASSASYSPDISALNRISEKPRSENIYEKDNNKERRLNESPQFQNSPQVFFGRGFSSLTRSASTVSNSPTIKRNSNLTTINSQEPSFFRSSLRRMGKNKQIQRIFPYDPVKDHYDFLSLKGLMNFEIKSKKCIKLDKPSFKTKNSQLYDNASLSWLKKPSGLEKTYITIAQKYLFSLLNENEKLHSSIENSFYQLKNGERILIWEDKLYEHLKELFSNISERENIGKDFEIYQKLLEIHKNFTESFSTTKKLFLEKKKKSPREILLEQVEKDLFEKKKENLINEETEKKSKKLLFLKNKKKEENPAHKNFELLKMRIREEEQLEFVQKELEKELEYIETEENNINVLRGKINCNYNVKKFVFLLEEIRSLIQRIKNNLEAANQFKKFLIRINSEIINEKNFKKQADNNVQSWIRLSYQVENLEGFLKLTNEEHVLQKREKVSFERQKKLEK